jgi:hypothetical protein
MPIMWVRNKYSSRLKWWVIAVALLMNSIVVQAGDNVRVKGHKIILLPYIGGIWQRSFFGEAEIGHVFNIHYVGHHPERTILANMKGGAEFNMDFKHGLWAPKFSTEIDLSFICIRGSLIDYTKLKVDKVYFTPEAGLTFAGFISVCYGYNQPLFNNGFAEINHHRISASLLIPVKLSGSSRYKKQHV